ncbi:leucine-rich repeat domain-containing glycoprotein 150 isoform X2 [Xylocopa sonorina]
MKVLLALLLSVLLLAVVVSSLDVASTSTGTPSTKSRENDSDDSGRSSKKSPAKANDLSENEAKSVGSVDERVTSKLERDNDLRRIKSFLNPKDMLLREIDTLNEGSSNVKTQTEVAETDRTRPLSLSSTANPTTSNVNYTSQDNAGKNVLDDVPALDYLADDDEEEDEDVEEYEEVMTQCPDYCKCAGEYAAATTATCTKLVDEQSFGTSIVHLRIENAEQIRLGPHAFLSLGLQQLQSIVITDTRIVDLNQSAFDGLPYLFSISLARNDLQDIHPSTFLNNKQLSLLTISGNPLKHMQELKLSKHGLFDAPSVTEFNFSFNGLTKLKRSAFSKMQSLIYINLKGNRLKEIDGSIFSMLKSLLEVDLSNNLLTEVPAGLLSNSDVETLRISGNNLASLSSIQGATLRVLDASNNKIKMIGKDDFFNMSSLDQLILSSNGLKKIHHHAFTYLDELTYLDLSNNKLAPLSGHHFKANSRLQVLLLNDNPELERLPVFQLSGFEYNTFNIYRFECSNCGLYFLDEGTFNVMPGITQLNLSRNRLSRLPNGLFAGHGSLQVLDLSDNIIDTLENDMFRGATGLMKLSLAGNPLTTLQVTPFLASSVLTKLDVSRCVLERVWSEARVPLTKLQHLSVRQNLLCRITVEELKATPNIVSLDLSHNQFDCDDEFKDAVQWLTDHGVTPVESPKYISNYAADDNYQDSEGISQWTELAKVVCDDLNDGPPPRPVPHKEDKIKILISGFDTSEDTDPMLKSSIESDEELLKLQIDHGMKSNEEVEKAWTTQNQEYEDFVPSESMEYRPWYTSALWPVVIVIVITTMILLLTVHIAIHLAKRRGQGPVIRPPMILRHGLIDNKNCGLVYKPLQEEIATPHVPKRGSFYSSSTFHYNKIVPESV